METKQQMAEAGVSVIQLPSADSLSTASVKEYAASFSSEPPPAYHKPRSTAVQVARIAGITLVAASAILGAFLLAAAWITARNSCSHHIVVPMPQASHSQGHEQLPSFDRLVDPLEASEQKLEAARVEHVANLLKSEDALKATTETPKKQEEDAVVEKGEGEEEDDRQSEEEEDEEDDGSDQNSEEVPIQIRLPLQLDFDELAGMLMERNMRSRMNCVVEKRKAEELVEHHPRTLQLPFGLNLTTDPRHERVSGERMAIFCESGHDQMQQQQRRPEMPFEFIPLMTPQQQQPQPIQQVQQGPMVVPLPGPIHLPFHFVGPMQQQQPQQQTQHQQIPMLHHPQAPHHEEPHMQGASFPQPQTIHIITPIHPQGIPQNQHQEILRRQMMEQEAMESMRPPPPPVPSAHQLPPHHQQGPAMHHMPQMGPVPGHQGPIISVHHLVALAESSADEDENQEGVPVGRAFREHVHQHIPEHQPLQHLDVQGQNIQFPEEHRPHYVQPRSVPSDPFQGELHRRDKRVKKRCACDCSC